jgi:type II secretory pathway pseudopilin PulG
MNEPSDFPPSAPASRAPWIVLGLLAALLLVAGLRYPFPPEWEGIRHIEGVTRALQMALAQYKQEFGEYPAGDNRAVSKALQGENPKKKPFIELGRNEVSPEGDLLDPWGTPYRFYFSGGRPLIRSAGENRQFDSSASKSYDDYFRD